MAKRVDPLVAKKAKQKKLAIILSVLLVGVVAFQGPKMLKMMKGPSATPAAAPATPATTPTGTADPAAPAAAAAVPEAVLADSDVAPDAESGQLLSIDSFSTKDPFAQQLEEAVPSDTPIPAAPDSQSPASTPAPSTPSGASDVPPGTFDPLGSNPQDQDPNAPPVSTTPTDTTPTVEAPPTATETTISINGVTESVAPKAEFPAADPVFVLESLAADGKYVLISVAGGTYTDGKQTVKLQIGKKLTLQNTSDGSRFELELLTVAGFVPPKK